MGNLIYSWTFDTGVFTATGATNQPTLVLSVNAGKDMDALVSPITVTIVNDEGCTITQTCWYTPDGMECGIIPCTNPIDLVVVNVQPTRCTGPIGLNVTISVKKY